MSDPIYLDHNATTPIDPRVAEAMLPFLTTHFGNPSSPHVLGRRMHQAVEEARQRAASLLDCPAGQIVFTSGGTEANNHALIGTALARQDRGDHLVTTAIEHPAVLEVCRHLAGRGFSFTTVGVDRHGRVDPDEVERAFTPRTILVSVMLANNEVGTLQPVAEIAARARARGIWSHSDCAQAVGKIPVRMTELGVDMISVAGHKFYAPKGVGLLALRPGCRPENLMFGAGHEAGRRPGTENVLEIVGLGVACELAAQALQGGESQRQRRLRDELEETIRTEIPEALINGHPTLRLPNTASISLPQVRAAEVMAGMPEIAVSAGAACHGDRDVLSHVLQAMQVPAGCALGTLRVSLGRTTTAAEVAAAGQAIVRAYRQARRG